ncbi:transcriptional repressor NrdR [Candidatus Daviesbacteria bacterium]|nr:transcriptional repressor NrdR [Candidatus Daviesbacteria bacterium]
MLCPFCGNQETRVVDKREQDNKTTRRRRECFGCSRRFTTFERAETLDTLVIKKDNHREAFDRLKIRNGIVKACEKRPVSADQIEAMVDTVEREVRALSAREISSKKIGELVMRVLRKVDKVAYIRFASVYREFTDLADFQKEVAKLINKK